MVPVLREFVEYLSTHPQIIAVGEGVSPEPLIQRERAFRTSHQLKVYVSGPYTQGDTITNVRYALRAGTLLRDAGYVPFIPHLFAFWELVAPAPYEVWMELDLAWVEACDALVRLPGDSPGADREVARAKERGIPVYGSVAEFLLAQ